MRVYEYAEQNSLENQQVLDACRDLGIDATSHSSGLTVDESALLDEHFSTPADPLVAVAPKAPSTPDADQPLDVALQKRIADLEAEIATLRKATVSSADDAAFVDSSKHQHAFFVQAIAGPKKDTPPSTIENCCDESEAIRRYAVRYGMNTSEHRYRAEKVKISAA